MGGLAGGQAGTEADPLDDGTAEVAGDLAAEHPAGEGRARTPTRLELPRDDDRVLDAQIVEGRLGQRDELPFRHGRTVGRRDAPSAHPGRVIPDWNRCR